MFFNKFQPLFVLLVAATTLMFTACEPEDPHEGEEEITTVNLTIDGTTISWKEGGAVPDIALEANKTYSVTISFLNEEDPNDVEDVTEEIRAEDDEHLVCYDVLGGANLTITRTDSDGQYEVGIETEWVTTDPSTGTLVVELRHQPDVKDGTCTPGDSDVEVEFNVEIQ